MLLLAGPLGLANLYAGGSAPPVLGVSSALILRKAPRERAYQTRVPHHLVFGCLGALGATLTPLPI